MKTTKPRLLAMALLLSIGAALTLWLLGARSGWTAQRIESEVNRELPLGSTCEQVEAFANAHGFSMIVFDDRQPDSQPSRIDGIGYEKSIWAGVPNPSFGFMTGGTIRVKFYFDKDNRLVRKIFHVERFNL